MQSVSFKVKIAACFAGGLLLCISGYTLYYVTGEVQSDITPARATTALVVASKAEALGVLAPTATSASLADASLVAAASPSPAPTRRAMPIPTPQDGIFSYHTISAGETLGYIAYLYNTDIENLIEMNDLDGPSALIQVDQTLRIPVQTDNVAPDRFLLPDSEVVYGPAYVDFDIAEFANAQQGYLAAYFQFIEGEQFSGAEIVERVSIQYSVGPRLLLALLEHYGGWLTNPTPTEIALQQPLGPYNPRGSDLYLALSFTANRINAGYYGYKRDGFWIFDLPDRSQAISAQGLNAGTVGLQNILAIHSDWDTWQQALNPDNGFMADYRRLFGDPARYSVGPPVPIDLTQPPLSLPWRKGKGFYFTSGPHAGFVDGSAWAAIDFGPPDILGNCFYSNEPVTAAADGVVVVTRQGEVYLDLDGDGNIQTGWTLYYLHVVADIEQPIQVGQRLKQGDVIGYASCEGGLSNSSHVHFARRYNGEWMAAGGPVPLNLSGWVVQPNLSPYEGKMVKGAEIREACECWDEKLNLIVNLPE